MKEGNPNNKRNTVKTVTSDLLYAAKFLGKEGFLANPITLGRQVAEDINNLKAPVKEKLKATTTKAKDIVTFKKG